MHRELCVQQAPAPVVESARPPALAGLPVLADAAELADRVSRQLFACRRFGTRLAVLVIQVNAQSAPMTPLLRAMGARLRGRLRSTDLVYQLGEQGFAVILLGAGPAHLPLVQHRLDRALGGPYGIDAQLLNASLRIGAAAYPQDGPSGGELVATAQASAGSA